MTYLTRALLRFQRGDRTGALADADVVARESAEAADSLRTYASIVFRAFDAWPWRQTFEPDPELDGVALELRHDVEKVRHAIGVYATRLGQLRAAIVALAGQSASPDAPSAGPPAWLPPETAHLLPSGPVVLRRETIVCDPDPDADPAAGAAPDTIEINETLATGGVGVPTLLAAAQADWSALAWLCWAVGLDAVRPLDEIETPTDVAAAMKLFVRRTWRIKDRLTSGGLIARSQGVPGFDWQGVDIDVLPRHLAEMAAAEYVGVRSMFLWLASPDAISPFQDDIQSA
jgi:hypothetical protein